MSTFLFSQRNPKKLDTHNCLKISNQQADQICYSVLCVFSYCAAGNDHKKSPLMQQKHSHGQPQIQQQQQTPAAKVQQHLPQQPTAKLQTIISKPGQTTVPPKPIQVPLKQAGQPVPVKSPEAVQPPQKLPSLPARKPSIPSSTSPPASEPPKVKPPQLAETSKRTQSVIAPTRGPPPPIPARSGSVQYPTVPTQQTRPVRRQSTINSSMPSCTPQPPPEFYIPQRRGSITRQQSCSSTTSSSSSKLSK